MFGGWRRWSCCYSDWFIIELGWLTMHFSLFEKLAFKMLLLSIFPFLRAGKLFVKELEAVFGTLILSIEKQFLVTFLGPCFEVGSVDTIDVWVKVYVPLLGCGLLSPRISDNVGGPLECKLPPCSYLGSRSAYSRSRFSNS